MDTRMNAHSGLKRVLSKHREMMPANKGDEDAQKEITGPCLDGVDENLRNYINGIIAKNVELEERITGLEIYINNLKGISNIWMDRSMFLENRLNISEAEAKFYKRLFEDFKDKDIKNKASPVLDPEVRNRVDERLDVKDRFKFPESSTQGNLKKNNGTTCNDLLELLIISKVTKREADILKIEHNQIESLSELSSTSPRVQQSPDILKIEHGEEAISDIHERRKRQCRSTSERNSKRHSNQEKKTPRAQSAEPSTGKRQDERNMSPYVNQAASNLKRAPMDNPLEFQIGTRTQKHIEEPMAEVKCPPLTHSPTENRYYTRLPPIVDGGKEIIPINSHFEENKTTRPTDKISDMKDISVRHGRNSQISRAMKRKASRKDTPATRLPRSIKPQYEKFSSAVNMHTQKATMKTTIPSFPQISQIPKEATRGKRELLGNPVLPKIRSVTAREQSNSKGPDHLARKLKAPILPDLIKVTPSKDLAPKGQKVQQPKHPFIGKSRELPPVVDLLNTFDQRRD